MLVHEMEIVRPRPRMLPRWLELSTQQFWPAFEAEGARVLAVFGTIFGKTPELTTVYEYPDAASFERTRLRAATPSGSFPGQEERDALTEHVQNRLLVPSPYWLVRPIPADGLFTTRTFDIEPGALERFHRQTAEVIWPYGVKEEGADYLALWTSAVGTPNQVVLLVRYEDFAHWDVTHPQRGTERDEKMVTWWDSLRERDRTTLGTEVRVLRRLPGWPVLPAAYASAHPGPHSP